MKKYRVFDIRLDWNIEPEDEGLDLPNLPSDVVIEVEDDFDPVEEIADYLSEEYGWCIETSLFEEIKE